MPHVTNQLLTRDPPVLWQTHCYMLTRLSTPDPPVCLPFASLAHAITWVDSLCSRNTHELSPDPRPPPAPAYIHHGQPPVSFSPRPKATHAHSVPLNPSLSFPIPLCHTVTRRPPGAPHRLRGVPSRWRGSHHLWMPRGTDANHSRHHGITFLVSRSPSRPPTAGHTGARSSQSHWRSERRSRQDDEASPATSLAEDRNQRSGGVGVWGVARRMRGEMGFLGR